MNFLKCLMILFSSTMQLSVLVILGRIWFVLLCILSAITLYPVLICVLTPILIYRQLVKTLVWWTDPKCRSIITGLSAVFAGKKPYDRPLTVLNPYMLFSENIDRKVIIAEIKNKIIKANLYPQLRQRIVTKYGYHFWKDVDNFSVERHVRFFTPDNPHKPVLRKDLRGIRGKQLAKEPFDKRYSPWEIVVVPNVVDPSNPNVKSAVYLRFNHCLMDGVSSLKFLQRFSSKPWVWSVSKTMGVQSPPTKVERLKRKVHTGFIVLFTLPYHVFCNALRMQDNSNFSKVARKDGTCERIGNIQGAPRVSAAHLKHVAKSHGVAVSSLIATILMGGVGKFINTKCAQGFAVLPKQFTSNIVVPLPGHPDSKLTNYCSFVQLAILLEDIKNPVKLLHRIHKEYTALANSVVPLINYLAFSIIPGWMPTVLHVDGSQMKDFIVFSSFPNSKEAIDIFGCPLVDEGFVADSTTQSVFGALSIFLYDSFCFELFAMNSLYKTEEDMELMTTCLQSVLKELE